MKGKCGGSAVFAAAIALFGFVGGIGAQQPDVGALMSGVEETLAEIETLECAYEQLYYRDADGRTMIRRGILALKEPSRFRLEDSTKTVIADGSVVWMYIPENNQVQISTFVDEAEEFPSPKSIFERYASKREAFWVSGDSFDQRTFDIIELPAPAEGETDVRVWIDRELRFPVMTFESYPNGDTVQYILRDLTFNEPLDDDYFTFVPPQGVDIVDLRE